MEFNPFLLFSIITLTFVAGLISGVYYGLKAYKSNKIFSVLPGQVWLLHGVGLVRVVHSAQPGSEILYLYNIEKSSQHVETGVCSREELIKNGMLLVEEDPDIPHDVEEYEGENIIRFPHTIEYDEDY